MDVQFSPEKVAFLGRVDEAIRAGSIFYFIPFRSIGPESFIDVDELRLTGMFREEECERFRNVPVFMFGSNNYLGLTKHPEVIASAKAAIDKYGTGCTGSRFLNGTLGLHSQLERKIAQAVGKDQAILISTGYQTNLGVISTLGDDPRDVILMDGLDHASIRDGAELSKAKVDYFVHNHVRHLDRRLREARRKNPRNVFVIVDGVFSMEGDIADLEHIIPLCEKYDAISVVDEAHATGVFGKTGMGIVEHYGLRDRVDIITSTFSKSWASIGGFVAANDNIARMLRWNTNSFMYSASLPPSVLGTVDKCLDITVGEEGANLRERLWRNTNHLRSGLSQMGYNTGNSCTPVVPVILGDSYKTIQLGVTLLKEYGIFTNVVPEKAVPKGMGLLRLSVMATHEPSQIEYALCSIREAGKSLGLLAA